MVACMPSGNHSENHGVQMTQPTPTQKLSIGVIPKRPKRLKVVIQYVNNNKSPIDLHIGSI